MKKWNKMKKVLCSILMTIMVVLTVMPAKAYGPYEIPANSVYMGNATHETVLNGTLSKSSPYMKYRLQVSKTSQVRISRIQDFSMCGISLILFDENGKYLQENQTKDSCRFYIQPGTFTLLVAPAVELGPNNIYGNYLLKVEIYEVYDTFPETKTKNNNHYSLASPINQDTFYFGSICCNEPDYPAEPMYAYCDFYKFHVYYDDVTDLFLSTNMWQITYAVSSVNDPNNYIYLETLVNDLNVDNTDYRNKDYTVPLSLEPGEYYLKLSSTGLNGTYDFRMVSECDLGEIYAGKKYVQVGKKTPVFTSADEGFQNYSLQWESNDSSVVTVDSKDRLNGHKAGITHLTGYGKETVYGFDAKVGCDVYVEFQDVVHGSDHGKNPYYYDAVYWTADAGIVGGIKDKNGVYSTFAPNQKCTRANIVAFLWRLYGCPEPKKISTFSDVPQGTYYYKAVSWAQENGITGGYSDGTFRPNGECTRGQIVSFLYRVAWHDPDQAFTKGFSDIHPEDGKYYNTPVLWAAECGITGGYSDGTFRPNGVCTRGQAVTFMYRMVKEGWFGQG